ncbi:unnamed protein product [Vicia faba]|uniref:Uncharacterized protein n=1 Tax=Vicia faba TaxID=3906 RepID=A0AAV1A0Y8_VICFA|nr:unnamed protein product [Vicia faba]
MEEATKKPRGNGDHFVPFCSYTSMRCGMFVGYICKVQVQNMLYFRCILDFSITYEHQVLKYNETKTYHLFERETIVSDVRETSGHAVRGSVNTCLVNFTRNKVKCIEPDSLQLKRH